jgi:hypothetical protein
MRNKQAMSTAIDPGNQDQEKEMSFDILTPSEVNQIERAEIDSAISTAKAYPRDIGQVKRDMMEMALLDEETAASMNYALPRAGKIIEGPSVRMAEVAVACYGNIMVSARIVETTGTYVKAQGIGHDLQKNVMSGIEVRRRVHPSKKAKDKKAALEDAIQLASAAATKIAYREAAFCVIPKALIKPVAEKAKKVAAGDEKTFKARRKTAMDKFAEFGIEPAKIFRFLGRATIDSLTTEDLQTLFGILTAIQDGATTPERAFDDEEDHQTANERETGVLREVVKNGSIYSADFFIPQFKRTLQVWTADEVIGENMVEWEDGDVVADLEPQKGENFKVVGLALARPDDAGKGKDDIQV